MFSNMKNFPFLKTGYGKAISLALVLIFFGSVALDHVSKRDAEKELLLWADKTQVKVYRSKTVPVWSIGDAFPEAGKTPFYFNLQWQYHRNTGAAFSMLADTNDSFRIPFFYGITLLAVLFILYYLKTLPANHNLTRLGLVLILSGAIGNFLDRITLGYVIDFIDVDWNLFGWVHDFAVFNVADVAINLGIVCYVLEVILAKKPEFLDGQAMTKEALKEQAAQD